MADLTTLLAETNAKLPKEWKFEYDGQTDDFKLLKVGAIKTEESVEDEWVATIHDMGDFWIFISAMVRRSKAEND